MLVGCGRRHRAQWELGRDGLQWQDVHCEGGRHSHTAHDPRRAAVSIHRMTVLGRLLVECQFINNMQVAHILLAALKG